LDARTFHFAKRKVLGVPFKKEKNGGEKGGVLGGSIHTQVRESSSLLLGVHFFLSLIRKDLRGSGTKRGDYLPKLPIKGSESSSQRLQGRLILVKSRNEEGR